MITITQISKKEQKEIKETLKREIKGTLKSFSAFKIKPPYLEAC